jgi:hypothetical protein
VTRSIKTGGALVGFGILLSQLGHLLIYQLEFGAAAQAVQSTGAHAYFPTLVKSGLGVAAAAVLGSLLVIGAARIVAGGRMRPVANAPSYVSLLGALFTIQLVFFALQETTESIAAGTAIASAPHLLLLGAVGQLPVALLAAVALKWLLIRFEAAVLTIRTALAQSRVAAPTPRLVLLQRALRLEPAAVEACPSVYVKRGPPPSLRS